MFSQVLAATLVALAIVSGAEASPVRHVSRYYPKFSSWHGIGSLKNFDDFYGRRNFDGHFNRQKFIKKDRLVCRRVDVKIIQQRLVVIQELAKKVISEQICEVETQTIVFQQFHSGLGRFQHDLGRRSGKRVGYDSHIAGFYGKLFKEDGSFSDNDLGFTGSDVGSQFVVPEGSNWNDFTSPPLVDDAQFQAQAAASGADVEDIDEGINNVGIAGVEDTGVDAVGAEAADAADANAAAGDAGVDAAAVPPADAGVDAAAVPPADAGVDAAAVPPAANAAAVPPAAADAAASSTAAADDAENTVVAAANLGGAAGRRSLAYRNRL